MLKRSFDASVGMRQFITNEPKNEPLLNQNPDSKICLNCDFPNRTTDSHCMYCQTSLASDSGLISWLRQTHYIIRWRWQLKQKNETQHLPNSMSALKAVGFFLMGVTLSGVGVFLFIEAVSKDSFSKGLIAILFLFYGVFTLKGLFTKK